MPLTVYQFPCLADNYAFLVRDEGSGEVACIDTPDAQVILRELQRFGGRLDLIMNTHWHADHAGGNAALQAATGARIIAPAEVARVSAVHVEVAGGERIVLGETVFEVLASGGHTLGHVAYYAPEAGVAFVGDTLEPAISRFIEQGVISEAARYRGESDLFPVRRWNGQAYVSVGSMPQGPSGSLWTLDDGSTVAGVTASRQYPQDGSHEVSLTVTDTVGSVVTDTLRLTVNNLPAVLRPVSDQQGEGSTSDLDGSVCGLCRLAKDLPWSRPSRSKPSLLDSAAQRHPTSRGTSHRSATTAGAHV